MYRIYTLLGRTSPTYVLLGFPFTSHLTCRTHPLYPGNKIKHGVHLRRKFFRNVAEKTFAEDGFF